MKMNIEKQTNWSEFLSYSDLPETAQQEFTELYDDPADLLCIQYEEEYYALCTFLKVQWLHVGQLPAELQDANICGLHNLNAWASIGIEISKDCTSYRAAYITT